MMFVSMLLMSTAFPISLVEPTCELAPIYICNSTSSFIGLTTVKNDVFVIRDISSLFKHHTVRERFPDWKLAFGSLQENSITITSLDGVSIGDLSPNEKNPKYCNIEWDLANTTWVPSKESTLKSFAEVWESPLSITHLEAALSDATPDTFYVPNVPRENLYDTSYGTFYHVPRFLSYDETYDETYDSNRNGFD